MLRRLWAGWKRVAKKIARFNSLVLCTALYALVIPLVAVPFRFFKDPLRLEGAAPFLDRAKSDSSLEAASRQG